MYRFYFFIKDFNITSKGIHRKMRYHINPTTNRINICKATIKCDFSINGIEPEHFLSKEEAKKHIEELEKKDNLSIIVQKKKSTQNINIDNIVKVYPTDVYGNDSSSTFTIIDKPEKVNDSIIRYKTKGSLVSKGIISPYFYKGKINISSINEESYKDFGFEKPDYQNYDTKRIKNQSFIKEISKKEIQYIKENNDFSENDFNNISLYSFSKYAGLINRILRNKNVDYSYQDLSKHLAIMKSLDKILSNDNGYQRVIYRGVRTGHIELGETVVFDAYSSCSYDRKTASFFGSSSYSQLNNNGTVFEILTSQGINISSLSDYKESEVLLPKETQFIVVGNHEILMKDDEKWNTKSKVIQMVAVDKNNNIL